MSGRPYAMSDEIAVQPLLHDWRYADNKASQQELLVKPI